MTTRKLSLTKGEIAGVYGGIALALGAGMAVAGGGGGGGGAWSPKWAIGDVLYSHALASASWVVKSIDYGTKRYGVDFSFAGTVERIFVDYANLESSDIYKV